MEGKRMLTEGSLFAGIMGFGEGFRRAGFRNLWAVEKEPFCKAVIKTHFPETEIFNDVHECHGGYMKYQPLRRVTAAQAVEAVAMYDAGSSTIRVMVCWLAS